MARQARPVRRRGGGPAGPDDVDPVDLLVADEDVEPALLAEVSTLARPPRVIAVYRRDDLPHGVRPVTLALGVLADPATSARSCVQPTRSARRRLVGGLRRPTGPKALRAAMGAVWRVPSPRVRYRARNARRARPAGGNAAAGTCRSTATSCSCSAPSGKGCRTLCWRAAMHGLDSAAGRRGVARTSRSPADRALRDRAAGTSAAADPASGTRGAGIFRSSSTIRS